MIFKSICYPKIYAGDYGHFYLGSNIILSSGTLSSRSRCICGCSRILFHLKNHLCTRCCLHCTFCSSSCRSLLQNLGNFFYGGAWVVILGCWVSTYYARDVRSISFMGWNLAITSSSFSLSVSPSFSSDKQLPCNFYHFISMIFPPAPKKTSNSHTDASSQSTRNLAYTHSYSNSYDAA